MIGNTNLEPKLFKKSLLKLFCYNNKVTRKVKDFKNSLIKKFTSPFNLKVLNTTNFHFHFNLEVHFMAKLP